MLRRLYNLAEWWHLLSLDAPTVAALWSWFFARTMHLRQPLLPALLLALGTWLLYVADRILDGLRLGEPLRERHHFHARHRTAFLSAACLLAVLLAWFVITRMRPEEFRDDSWIGVFALLYLFAVHRGSSSACLKAFSQLLWSHKDREEWFSLGENHDKRRGFGLHQLRNRNSARRIPKELAVAILFATATAVPAWSRLGGSGGNGLGKEQLAPAVVFFAVLCWINCVGIEKWEAGGSSTARVMAHPTTRWASLHLRRIVTVIALFSLAAALLAPSTGLTTIYLAALLSSGLLFALDARSPHLSPLQLRIAADAALLTPLAFFPFAR